MQRLEVSGAVRPIYGSLGVKPLTQEWLYRTRDVDLREVQVFALSQIFGWLVGCLLGCLVKLVILHTYLPMKMGQGVPKRRDIKFRRRGITQKKAYNV